jgi:hypothetical protein
VHDTSTLMTTYKRDVRLNVVQVRSSDWYRRKEESKQKEGNSNAWEDCGDASQSLGVKAERSDAKRDSRKRELKCRHFACTGSD